VASGYSAPKIDSRLDFAVCATNEDGSLDYEFGTGARSRHWVPASLQRDLQPTGKDRGRGGRLGVARYNADGSLDTAVSVLPTRSTAHFIHRRRPVVVLSGNAQVYDAELHAQETTPAPR